jgi:hypothetical protein
VRDGRPLPAMHRRRDRVGVAEKIQGHACLRSRDRADRQTLRSMPNLVAVSHDAAGGVPCIMWPKLDQKCLYIHIIHILRISASIMIKYSWNFYTIITILSQIIKLCARSLQNVEGCSAEPCWINRKPAAPHLRNDGLPVLIWGSAGA